ncbi:MAG: RNA-binding S4 domain-containing protein [Rhodobiaceae bacterium]|nr:RNA-binding S4 domain-containing protein [Rhodobiaceae bacterium]MCC0016686.1 RNA-binding S4 domain-containing protein [Rhodobiaceae bacterium]MCC0054476.1 RNA-binding S4 domain-containing protein [Rhodobiaceae bacterium]
MARTRPLAGVLVRSGAVRINRQRALRPSATVRIGDVLTLALPSGVRVLEVAALPRARLGADPASALYRDRQHTPQ